MQTPVPLKKRVNHSIFVFSMFCVILGRNRGEMSGGGLRFVYAVFVFTVQRICFFNLS
jgi:hypothetical protein